MTTGPLPTDRRYTASHEWIQLQGDELVVGITDHAQSELTDIVFVDLPKVGHPTHAGQSVLVLESVKTVADIYAPADGELTAVNTELKAHPELINQDPYHRGWIYRMRPKTAFDPSKTLDAAGYTATLG